MQTNRLRLRRMVAIVICLLGTVMFSGCEIYEEPEVPPIPTSYFTLSSAGNQTGVIFGENIVASITGSGTLTLSGTCNFAEIAVRSAGCFSGSDLEIRAADVISTGSGSIYIWVKESLTVRIGGSGNVYYKGNPIINSQIGGSGKLIKME